MGDHIQADVLAVCGEHANDAPIRGEQALHVDEEVLLAREASPEVLNDDQIVTLARHLAQAVRFEVDVGAKTCRGTLTQDTHPASPEPMQPLDRLFGRRPNPQDACARYPGLHRKKAGRLLAFSS